MHAFDRSQDADQGIYFVLREALWSWIGRASRKTGDDASTHREMLIRILPCREVFGAHRRPPRCQERLRKVTTEIIEAAQRRRRDFSRLSAILLGMAGGCLPVPVSHGDEDDRRAVDAPESLREQCPALSPIAQGQPNRTREGIRRTTPHRRTVGDPEAEDEWPRTWHVEDNVNGLFPPQDHRITLILTAVSGGSM